MSIEYVEARLYQPTVLESFEPGSMPDGGALDEWSVVAGRSGQALRRNAITNHRQRFDMSRPYLASDNVTTYTWVRADTDITTLGGAAFASAGGAGLQVFMDNRKSTNALQIRQNFSTTPILANAPLAQNAPVTMQWYLLRARLTQDTVEGAVFSEAGELLGTVSAPNPFAPDTVFYPGVYAYYQATFDEQVVVSDSYVLLPDYATLSFDVKYNNLAALSFEYPESAAKALGLKDGSTVGVVVSDGQDPKEVEKYIVTATGGDRVSDGALLKTFTGTSTLSTPGDANVYPSNWNPVTKTGGKPPGHEFVDARIGTIWRTLILRAKQRGCFPFLDETSFDGLADSNGVAWAAQISANYGTGENYSRILQDQMDRGLVDAWVEGNTLKMLNGGTRGTHIGIGTLELRPAKNLSDIAVSTDSQDSASAVFIEGDDGVVVERVSTQALQELGRRRERAVNQQGISDVGTLTLLADAELTTYGRIPAEETLGVAATLTPFFDFDVADWVWVRFDTEQPAEERRIWQIAVSVNEDRDIQIGVTANTILFEDDIKLRRKVEAYTGAAGSYGALNSGVDTSIPNPPSGLSSTTDVFLNPDGTYSSVVLLQWTPPTTNVGGSSITDLAGYEYDWQYVGETQWTSLQTETGPGRVSPVSPGTFVNLRVRSVDQSGNRSAYATLSNQPVAKDTVAPPSPSTPTATPTTRGVRVAWNGLTSTGQAMPADFDYVEVWQGTANNFTPGTGGTSLVTTLKTGGVATIPGATAPATTHVRLVARDKGGLASVIASGTASSVAGGQGDGAAPASSPKPVLLPFGVNMLEWRAVPTLNEDRSRFRVYLCTRSTFSVADPDVTLVSDSGDTQGIITSHLNLPLIPAGSATTDIPLYYIRVVQFDDDGAATAGLVSDPAQPRRAATHELSADAGFFGEVQAEKIRGRYITSQLVVANEIATDEPGRNRVGMESQGFFSESYYTVASTTLSAAAAFDDASLTVTSASNFPLPPFVMVLDQGQPTEEYVDVKAVSGTTLTVERRPDQALAHSSGSTARALQVTRPLSVPNSGDPTFAGNLQAKSALFREGFETRGRAVGAANSEFRLNNSLGSPTTPPLMVGYRDSFQVATSTPPSGITASAPTAVGHPVYLPTSGKTIIPVTWGAPGGALGHRIYWRVINTNGTSSWVYSGVEMSWGGALYGAAVAGDKLFLMHAHDLTGLALSAWTESTVASGSARTHLSVGATIMPPAIGSEGGADWTVGDNPNNVTLSADGTDLWFVKIPRSTGTADGTSVIKDQPYMIRRPFSLSGTKIVVGAVNKRATAPSAAVFGAGDSSRMASAIFTRTPGAYAHDYGQPTVRITNRQISSNVAIITTAESHGLTVGDSVTIQGVGSPFDGTYTVSTVSSGTVFRYAKTNANIASGAAPAGASAVVPDIYATLTVSAGFTFGYGTHNISFRLNNSPGATAISYGNVLAWYGGAGLTWNPVTGTFWGLVDQSTARAVTFEEHAKNKKSGIFRAYYTWSDMNLSGDRHETMLSPPALVNVFSRFRSRLESAAIPIPQDVDLDGNPDPTTDDPTGVKFYISHPDAGLTLSKIWRVGNEKIVDDLGTSYTGHTEAAFGTQAVLTFDDMWPDNVTAPAYSISAGLTQPPSSNSFASSALLTAFKFTTESGGGYFRGDGAIGSARTPVDPTDFISKSYLESVLAASVPHFRAEHSAGTTVGSSSTNNVSWGSVQRSTPGDFSLSNVTRDITIAKAGVYQVNATVGYSSSSAGVRYVYIYRNGSQEAVSTNTSATTNITMRVAVSQALYCDAGDVISIGAFHNAGSNLTLLTGPSTSVSIVRIGS